MCGIIGYYSFEEKLEDSQNTSLLSALKKLGHRGPDYQSTYSNDNVLLGHTRLSIIDTSNAGNQPFIDSSGNYSIIFNGEFYNYKRYKDELIQDGVSFKSESDTEVLLYLMIKYGEHAIEKINGCFAFAFYNHKKNEIILARDRMGINPLLYYFDGKKIIFSSELKAVLEFDVPREINYSSLYTYLQLNYLPNNKSMIKGFHKLEPGNYLTVNSDGISEKKYYDIKYQSQINSLNVQSYSSAKEKLFELLDASVKRRLLADVPVGCFLSGGIDSSVITALAAGHTNNLNTFSVGFDEGNFFDETDYANLVAKKFNTNHTVFKISQNQMLEKVYDIIDYFDEPFADSSAIAVHLLSKFAKTKVSVALSGDGADEMFAGYNKHLAHYKISKKNALNSLIKNLKPIWSALPKSRNSKFSNFIRQLHRFSIGGQLSPSERYWLWASIGSESYAESLLLKKLNYDDYLAGKTKYLRSDFDYENINDVLFTDMKLVLPGDMLTKVDLMSMSNSLEVRTPFLDHNVVDFVFSLPASYKITGNSRKKILKDTFKDLLPDELLKRGKKGFEVPLRDWLKNQLWSDIDNIYLSENYIIEQNIFNFEIINALKKQLHSKNPMDSHAKIWAILVFQRWYQNYIVK